MLHACALRTSCHDELGCTESLHTHVCKWFTGAAMYKDDGNERNSILFPVAVPVSPAMLGAN